MSLNSKELATRNDLTIPKSTIVGGEIDFNRKALEDRLFDLATRNFHYGLRAATKVDRVDMLGQQTMILDLPNGETFEMDTGYLLPPYPFHPTSNAEDAALTIRDEARERAKAILRATIAHHPTDILELCIEIEESTTRTINQFELIRRVYPESDRCSVRISADKTITIFNADGTETVIDGKILLTDELIDDPQRLIEV